MHKHDYLDFSTPDSFCSLYLLYDHDAKHWSNDMLLKLSHAMIIDLISRHLV